jgi:hypothetical protein
VSLEQDLRVLASTDALTGLVNRRAFMERFSHELARSQRHGARARLKGPRARGHGRHQRPEKRKQGERDAARVRCLRVLCFPS